MHAKERVHEVMYWINMAQDVTDVNTIRYGPLSEKKGCNL